MFKTYYCVYRLIASNALCQRLRKSDGVRVRVRVVIKSVELFDLVKTVFSFHLQLRGL